MSYVSYLRHSGRFFRLLLPILLCLVLRCIPAHALTSTFSSSTVSGLGITPISAASADFNNDNKADLAILDGNGTVTILYGNGNGTFQFAGSFTSGSNPICIATGKFNNSGMNKNDLALLDNTGTTIHFHYNNGGSFSSNPDKNIQISSASSIKGADNGQSTLSDLLLVDQSGQLILLSGLSNWSSPNQLNVSAGASTMAITGKLNGDTIDDLVTINGTGAVFFFPGTSTNSFGSPYTLTSNNAYTDLAIGDFTGDGRDDIIIVNQGSSSLTLLTNTTAPAWGATYPKAGTATSSSAQIRVMTSDNSIAYLVCLASGSTAPTPQQVKTGWDAYNINRPNSNASLSADIEASLTCSNLSSATVYDLYSVAEGLTGYLQAAPAKITVTTPPETPHFLTTTLISSSGFTANWQAVTGATAYAIDVSTDSSFSTFVSNLENHSVGSGTSFAATSLTPATTYYFRVRATVGGATSPSSIPGSVFTLPQTPTVTAATSVTSTSFTANWNPVVGASGYFLDIATDAGFTAFVIGFSNKFVSAATSQLVTGLTAVTTYHYRVRTYQSGATSTSSSAGTVMTLPTTPSTGTATDITSTGFTANWSAVGGADGYFLDVSTDAGFTSFVNGFNNQPLGTATSSALAGLSPLTTYYYRVRVSANGSTSASSSPRSVVTLPTTPTVNAANAVTSSSFTANWGSVAGASEYFLDVATDAGFTSIVNGFNGYAAGNVLSFSVTGLTPATPYYFRVRAFAPGAMSASSQAGMTTTLPQAPTIGTVQAVSTSSFTASWSSISGVSEYFLDVATDVGFTQFANGYNNRGVGIETTYVVVDLTPVTTYYFRVRASVAGATSISSNTGSATTLPPVPGFPTLGAAESVKATGFTANWGAVPYAGGYLLDIALDPGFSTIVAPYQGLDTGNVTSRSISGLASGGTYYYRVKTYNASGTSQFSQTATIILPPAAPALKTVTSSMNGFLARWSAVAGAGGYRLDISTDPSFLTFFQNYNNRDVGNVLSCMVSGTTPGVSYYFRVRSYNSTGTSSGTMVTVSIPATPPVLLNTPQAFQTGLKPLSSVTADFNGDGIPDVAVANQTGKSISILLGTGDRMFAAPVELPCSYELSRIISGDINSDGAVDLLAISYYGGTISLFLGNGNGTFQSALTTAVGSYAQDAIIGDFTGDGKPDLALTNNYGPNSFSIFPGNGDGTFDTALVIPSIGSPVNMVSGDFNSDGKLDLAYDTKWHSYGIALNNGDGTFASTIYDTLTDSSYYIDATDLNGDGVIDLAVMTLNTETTSDNGTVHILLGNGNGTFTAQTPLPGGTYPSAIKLADINHDGKSDLLVAANSGDTLMLYHGNGNGSFQAPVTMSAPKMTTSITVADFDGDGLTDIGMTGFNDSTFTVFRQAANGTISGAPAGFFPSVGPLAYLTAGDFNKDGAMDVAGSQYSINGDIASALYGDGTGSLTVKTDIPLSISKPSGILATDLNGDGASDIIINGGADNQISVVLSNVSESFNTPQPYIVAGAQNRSAVGDFNNDGFPDIAVVNMYADSVSILLNDGSGSFTPSVQFTTKSSPTPRRYPNDIAVADFNGDGHLDLVVADSAVNTIAVLTGNGNGEFAAPVIIQAGQQPANLTTGDFNHDGKADIAVSDSIGNSILIFIGNGNGTFQTAVSYPAGTAPNQIVQADMNGDGISDLVIANGYDGYLTILPGKSDGTFLPAQHYWAGNTSAVTAGSFTSSNKIDLAVSDARIGGVTLLRNSTQPNFESAFPRIASTSSSTAQVIVKSTLSGIAYVVCLPAGSTTPTTNQIKAGQDSTGSVVASSMRGSTALMAHVSAAIPLSSLVSGSSYDVYVILEDTQNAIQPVPALVRLTQPQSIPLQQLSVTVSGMGTVYSSSLAAGSPTDITCSIGTCSSDYPEGSLVNLLTLPSWYSTTSWNGTDNQNGNAAAITMSSARQVTVTFEASQNVQLSNPAGYLGSVLLALDAAANGATIKAKNIHFPDVITFSKVDTAVTLDGGWTQFGDQNPVGFSTIRGPLAITRGRINIKGGIKILP